MIGSLARRLMAYHKTTPQPRRQDCSASSEADAKTSVPEKAGGHRVEAVQPEVGFVLDDQAG